MTEQELRDEFEHEAWCDTQNNISKICNCMMGYPLEVIENLQETIEKQKKEIEGKSHLLSMALDQIKAKDAEIEIHWEVRNKQNKAIAEAREIIALSYDFIEDGDFMGEARKTLCGKAKVWLESNK